jgi:hypothetical protein
MVAAEFILRLAALYAALGLTLAAGFVGAGIPRALPAAGRLTIGARLLLLPGAALLWPYVLWRWAVGRR